MNKEQKRRIVGVAVISGVILVSVSAVGITKYIDEKNAVEAKSYITAYATNFNDITGYKTINGIMYTLDSNSKEATVIGLDNPSDSSGVIGVMENFPEGVYVNIPQTITVDNVEYTIRTIGDGNNSIFTSEFINYMKYGNGTTSTDLEIILPKTTTKVAKNAITNLTFLSNTCTLVNLSNSTTFETNSVNDGNKIIDVYGVPGSGAESQGTYFYNLYKTTDLNTIDRTISINGFNEDAFNNIPVEAKINIKFPDYMTIEGNSYTVTKISDSAFAKNKLLKNVVFSSMLETIGNSSFKECPNMNWIKVLSKTVNIVDGAFEGNNIKKVYGLTGSTAETYYKANVEDSMSGIAGSSWGNITVLNIEVDKNLSKTKYITGEKLKLVLNVTFQDDDGHLNYGHVTSGYTSYTTPTYAQSSQLQNNRLTDIVGSPAIYIDYEGERTFTSIIVEVLHVEGVDIDIKGQEDNYKTDVELNGNYSVIEAVISPTNATTKDVDWFVGNSNIIEISPNNANTSLTSLRNIIGVKEGITRLTVTTKDGGYTDYCIVVVGNVKQVTLDKQGGQNGSDMIGITSSGITVDDIQNYTGSINIPSKEGYNFEGFFTEENGKGEMCIDSLGKIKETNITENTTWYAYWTTEGEKDTVKPNVIVKGEKNSAGKYIVYITATDENSGIKSVEVKNENGEYIDITSSISNGTYSFMPKANGYYTIRVTDNSENVEEKIYEVTALLEKATIEPDKNSEGKYIVYITPQTNKNIKSIKVNGTEITENKTEDGRYYFETTKNGTYYIEIQYEEVEEIEKLTYNEIRYTNNNNNNNENSNKKNDEIENEETTEITKDETTSLVTLPDTGSKIGTVLATIMSAITAVFTWFKQRK